MNNHGTAMCPELPRVTLSLCALGGAGAGTGHHTWLVWPLVKKLVRPHPLLPWRRPLILTPTRVATYKTNQWHFRGAGHPHRTSQQERF